VTWVSCGDLVEYFLSHYSFLQDFQLASIFGVNLYFPLCPYPGYDALYTALLGFIMPAVLIMTIAAFIVRCVKPELLIFLLLVVCVLTDQITMCSNEALTKI